MPFKESRFPRLLARDEHDLERSLELIRLAIAATLADWKVYPVPGWHGVPVKGRTASAEGIDDSSKLARHY